jgi:hypothetical protein
MASQVTGIEFLSKTRQTYSNELSFAGRGLKLNTEDDGRTLIFHLLQNMEVKYL